MATKKQTDLSYKKIPALAEYVDRIGAEQLNFKTFMVKEYKGHYYTERCLIKINDKGEIECSNSEYAPTKDEIAKIKGAFETVAADFPRSITVTPARARDFVKTLKNKTYEFLSLDGNEIVMVQETFKKADGQKVYVPWTYWSDGEWRKMEPERKLPFWKPPKRKDQVERSAIMIHEGAKAAKFVTELIMNKGKVSAETYPDDKEWRKKPWYDVHPWYEELLNYRHWGIIGGALAPHRTDYSELSREKPTEVIYICDNDIPGKSALKDVSRLYGNAMKGVYFDGRWKESWDMADPLPKKFFKDGKYVGKDAPVLSALFKPATWATEMVPTGEKGKQVAILKSSFAQKIVHSIKPEIYIHLDHPGEMWTAREFSNLCRPFTHRNVDVVPLVEAHDEIKSAYIRYRPDMPSGIFADESGVARYFNTYCPPNLKAQEGSIEMYEEFMAHLFPVDSDRKMMMDYVNHLATINLHGNRLHFATLMVSETQGVGKSTLLDRIMKPLVGPSNAVAPTEETVVEGVFNDWMARKVLGIIHEIYAGHSMKAYDKLKNAITESTIEIHQKYQNKYTMDNWLHIMACSNSTAALRISSDDRRWFIPKVTERTKGPSFWKELNSWLVEGGGLQAIKWHAEKWLAENGPLPFGMNAPYSDQKKTFIEESYSTGKVMVLNMMRRLRKVLDHDEEEEASLRKTLIRDGVIYLLDERDGKERLRSISIPTDSFNREGRLLKIDAHCLGGKDKGVKEETRPIDEDGRIILEEGEKLFAFFLDIAAIDLIKQKQYDGKHSDRLERPLQVRKVAITEGWVADENKLTVKGWKFGAVRMILPYPQCKNWPITMIWQKEERKGGEVVVPRVLLKPVDPLMLHDDFKGQAFGNDEYRDARGGS